MTESLFINAGAVVLTPAACAALLDVVTPDRDAALDADGAAAARTIRNAGMRHAARRRADLGPISTTATAKPSRLPSDLVDVDGAATYLAANARTVRKWADAGRIGTKVGNAWIFTFAELDTFARRGR